MPSSSRRRFLAVAGTASLAGVAGCSALGRSRSDVNPATGLAQDTSQALTDEVVYLAGDDSDLPMPEKTTDSLDDAVYVQSTRGPNGLAIIDAATGEARRTISLPVSTASGVALANEAVFFVGQSQDTGYRVYQVG